MTKKDVSLILERHITELNEKEALSVIERCLEAGDDPLSILRFCQKGMRKVGERYEKREYFISGLIMAGEIFRQAMGLLKPNIREMQAENFSGTILIGTVAGDIHDLGKDMVSELLMCHGFNVHDLGVNVPPENFLKASAKLAPDIIGMSILITNALDSLKETVTLLRKHAPSSVSKIPIIIGGSLTNEDVCSYAGADYWVNDAMDGVRLSREIVSEGSKTV